MATKQKDTRKMMTIGVVIIAAILVVVVLKHLRLKQAWKEYATTSQTSIMQWGVKSTQDQGTTIAAVSSSLFSGKPLFRNGRDFETYIQNVSKQLNRDIVVVDKNNVILADTVIGNIGKKFSDDENQEVQKTVADGVSRSFTEKSTDYPNGLKQTVVAMKDSAGSTVGAVILSSDPLVK